MEHVVAKAFKTVNRRFAAGAVVLESEVEGFDEWVRRGFVAVKRPSPLFPARTPPSKEEGE